MTFQMPPDSGGDGPDGPAATQVKEPPAARGRVLVPTLLALGALVLLFVVFAGIYSERLWYVSVDKTEVFTVRLLTQIAMFVAFGLLMALVLLLVMGLAYRARPTFGSLTAEQVSLARYRMSIEPFRTPAALGIAALFGVMSGLSAAAEWETFQVWRNGVEFGSTDAQFGIDIGFFLFTLPWLRFILGFLFAMILLSLLASAAVHYLYGGIRLQSEGRRFSRSATRHIAFLAGLLVLIKAGAYWLDRLELTIQSKDLVPGFTGLNYTDVNAVLPSRTILAFAAVLVALLFFFAAIRGIWAPALIGTGLLLATSIIIGWAYPAFVQYFQVRPTELEREAPFIDRNIQATLKSYDLEEVEPEDYAGNEVASVDVIAEESGTLENVRLLDPAIVSPTFRQLQQIRGFYAFPDALDVDRYTLDGEQRGMTVAMREIDLEGLPVGQRNWTNDTTVFTHGYGFVGAYDNTALSNGQPSFAESDIPPSGVLDIDEPRIYFGQLSPQYSIVGAPEGAEPQEFDYPDDASPNAQRNNTYSGEGGAPVGSLLNKLIFATKFQDTNILLSDRVNPESRILWDRDPRDRVEKVAPWLTLDGDPYPVVADGRIVWVLDAYTTSNAYPNAARTSLFEATSDSITTRASNVLSQNREYVNYMRNSVKATVDAYDGTVTLYAWDEDDPILQVWRKVFPDLVVPVSDMSEELLAHARYPEDLFKVQRTIYSRYHVQDPSAFYSGQDFWIIPVDPTKPTQDALQPPYYLTLQMPGESRPAFSLTTAYAPSKRQTLAAFMAVNSEPGPNYGKIRVLQLPRNTTIPGPTQVQNNFNSDPVVAQQLNLLRRGNSDIDFGNLLSLPIADGMLYVEPVYVRAVSEQGFPLLRKVLVGYGPKVAMEDTLEQALAQVFVGTSTGDSTGDGGGSGGAGDPTDDLNEALAEAQRAYADGEAALARGDFTAYGEAQERLKDALDRAARIQAELTGEPVPGAEDDLPSEDVPLDEGTAEDGSTEAGLDAAALVPSKPDPA